jgi:uncharacterized protein
VKASATAGLSLASAVAGGLAYGWFEAGWVRLGSLEVPIPGLAPELDGLRVVHLSDFHLGIPSRGAVAVERAVEWAAVREPDLTAISGDLLSHPRAEPRLRRLVERLTRCYAVLGNHDVDAARDPFSRASDLDELPGATLLRDESATLELRGRRVQVVGVDPLSYPLGLSRPQRLVDPEADLRILICHYPAVLRRLDPDWFHLVLAGHLHGGQICLPWPGGKIRLAHPRARYAEGLYAGPPALHVSAGLGTTFLPFRFFARPEATELVLRAA